MFFTTDQTKYVSAETKREIVKKYFANGRNFPTIASWLREEDRKYTELIKKLRKIGCVDTGSQQAGHPLWYSPKTGKTFQLSNHTSQEVATGTLGKILKDAGLE